MTVPAAPLRLGILGAARIAPAALIRPARNVADARIIAVAARDRDKADEGQHEPTGQPLVCAINTSILARVATAPGIENTRPMIAAPVSSPTLPTTSRSAPTSSARSTNV